MSLGEMFKFECRKLIISFSVVPSDSVIRDILVTTSSLKIFVEVVNIDGKNLQFCYRYGPITLLNKFRLFDGDLNSTTCFQKYYSR